MKTWEEKVNALVEAEKRLSEAPPFTQKSYDIWEQEIEPSLDGLLIPPGTSTEVIKRVYHKLLEVLPKILHPEDEDHQNPFLCSLGLCRHRL